MSGTVEVKLFILLMINSKALGFGYHGIRLHQPTKAEIYFKDFDTKSVELEFRTTDDKGFLKTFFLDNLQKLEEIEKKLEKLSDVEDFMTPLTRVLEAGQSLVTVLDKDLEYYPDIDRPDSDDRCILYSNLYRKETQLLKGIDNHFSEVIKTFGPVTANTISNIRSRSNHFELFDDLDKIFAFMNSLQIAVFNNDLYVANLVDKEFHNSHLALFETLEENCKITDPHNLKIIIKHCHSIEAGTLCYSNLVVGKSPSQVIKFEPIFYNKCAIDHIYYLNEKTQAPHDLICLNDNKDKFSCYLGQPSPCTLATLSNEISRILTQCNFTRSNIKHRIGLDTFAFFQITDADRALIFATVPQVAPESIQAPIIFKKGKYKFTFKTSTLAFDFGNRLEIIRPRLGFNKELLCPNSIKFENNSSDLRTLVISSIIPIILSLAGLGVYSTKFFKKKVVVHRERRTRRSNRRTRRRREENELNSFIELLTRRTD